ncbi:hypothetical protein Tco_0645538 [Tanacetum coccineum]
MYDDVSPELKDAKLGDEEMTDAEKVNAELEEVNQEDASAQVQDEAQATAPAQVASSSRSISSNYGSIFLNLDNISSVERKIISMLDVQVQHENPSIHSSSLLIIPVSVIPESTILSSIRKTVTAAPATTIPPPISPPIPPFIPHTQHSTSIPTQTTIEATTSTPAFQESETLSVVHLRVSDLEKEVKELKKVDHSSALLATIKYEVLTAVKEYLGTSLDDALYKHPANSTTYARLSHLPPPLLQPHAVPILSRLHTSFILDNSHLALYHALIESILEDEDAMDKGVVDKLKKRNPDDADKDEDPPAGQDQGLRRQKTSKDTEPSKKAKPTGTSKSTTKSQTKSTGKSAQAEETVFEAGDTQLPHNLGEDMGKTDEPPIVKADPKDWFKKPKRPPTPDLEWNTCKTVDDGPTQNWLSDLAKAEKSSKTFSELMSTLIDFTAFAMNRLVSKHDVYSTKRIMAVTNIKVNKWYGYGHLEEIEVRRADQQLYKFMEGDFPRLHLNNIEDMLLLIVQKKIFNLKSYIIVDLVAALRVIYKDKLNRKRLRRSNELHKFSDDTLQSLWDTLHDMATNLRTGYNKAMPSRRRSNLDKTRSHIMVKDIDRQLLERRLMRSLEKKIGGREYEEDLRLLQRTI